jgi:hypothetical protein
MIQYQNSTILGNRVTRRFGKKITQVLEKVAKTVAKLNMLKYLHQNIYIKLLLNYLSYLQQTIFSPKKSPDTLKVAQRANFHPIWSP